MSMLFAAAFVCWCQVNFAPTEIDYVIPAAPQSPPPVFWTTPGQSAALADRSMKHCQDIGRTCHVEPDVGIIMEPKK